jgi:uncharacterized protein (DUF1810 family)
MGRGASIIDVRSCPKDSSGREFALSGLHEARAYLAHPVLGRLVEVSALLLSHAGEAPETILGPVDAQKVRSCMTLFEAVPGSPPVFAQVLDALYDGGRCLPTRGAVEQQGPRA